MEEDKKRLLVIDSNSVIHRAYHALPPLSTKEGIKVNAVYGFLLVFFKALREFRPDFVAAAFDLPVPTFRHRKYKEYKAKRVAAPPDLYQQIPMVKKILEAFDVPVLEKEGYEADDIIGTVSKMAQEKDRFLPEIETIILSGDLDNLQLVNGQTKVYALRKGVKDIILYDEKLISEKYQGLTPGQLIDFKALRGDPSDNIPGVSGIGEKGALGLIQEFGSLENIYENIGQDTEKSKNIKPRTRELLVQQREQAFLSKTLVSIDVNSPLDVNFGRCRWEKYDKEKASAVLKEFEFFSLLAKLP